MCSTKNQVGTPSVEKMLLHIHVLRLNVRYRWNIKAAYHRLPTQIYIAYRTGSTKQKFTWLIEQALPIDDIDKEKAILQNWSLYTETVPMVTHWSFRENKLLWNKKLVDHAPWGVCFSNLEEIAQPMELKAENHK